MLAGGPGGGRGSRLGGSPARRREECSGGDRRYMTPDVWCEQAQRVSCYMPVYRGSKMFPRRALGGGHLPVCRREECVGTGDI